MPIRLFLCFVLLFFHAALLATPAAAGKKGHGGSKHAHHGNHNGNHNGNHGGHHGGRTQVNFSPYGFNIGFGGDHFGISLGSPWQASRASYYAPRVVGPVPYAAVDSFYAVPTPSPDMVYSNRPGLIAPRPLAPPAVAPNGLGFETTIPTNLGAVRYQAQAERAFRYGRFDLALPAVRHAIAEDPDNGKLMLFESQVQLARGDYGAAAEALDRGTGRLSRNEWGFVVKRYDRLYPGEMYAHQMRTLEAFLHDHPDDIALHLLRGYHYFYLGRTETGQSEFATVLALEPNNRLALALSQQAPESPLFEAPSETPSPIEWLPSPATPLGIPVEE